MSHADTKLTERERLWLRTMPVWHDVMGVTLEARFDALLAELELSRNLYDELFSQTEQLRTDRDALCAQVAQLHDKVSRYERALYPQTHEQADALNAEVKP